MAASQGWYEQWFANGWFPAVWFAPGDESHLTPEETETRRPRRVNLRRIAAVEVAGAGVRLSVRAGPVSVVAGRVAVTAAAAVSGARTCARAGVARVACGVGAPVLGARLRVARHGCTALAVRTAASFAGGWRIRVGHRRGTASGGAAADLWVPRVVAYSGSVKIAAVRNPTDEELVLAMRARRLTRGIPQRI